MTNIPAVVNPRAPKRMVGCELLNLAAHNPADLVQLSEQQYQSRIDAAAAYVLASGRRIVMLTGPSAAGKTTSANKLAAAMRSKGVRSRVLSLDDFFVGEGRYPKQPDGRDDYECVEALDIPLVQHCLQQLAQTGVCDAPIFDFMTQLPAPQTQHIDCTDGVVVVEGLHAFNPILTETLPQDAVLNIYASLREEYAGPDGARLIATRDVRLARRITRDWRGRGGGGGPVPWAGCPVAAEQHRPRHRADAGRQLVQRTDGGGSGPAGAGASAAGEVGAGVVT